MSGFFAEYGLFFAKTLTLVIAIILTVVGIVIIASRGKDMARENLEIKKLNDKFDEMADTIKLSVLSKEELKATDKAKKKAEKETAKKLKSGELSPRKRIYVLEFDGDIKASPLASLRQEITAILSIANQDDEVFVHLQSGGGLVHAYGLAASQLIRIKDKGIPLTVSVDNVAASGGYMMACVADKIIAAPFSIIGSIGVIAQFPNFNRLLKKHDIDFEQVTAGEFKRTVTMFGENTDKAREKFREELDDMHVLFKEFIVQHRPIVDIDRIATGEHWPARRALELKLVDELKTSDEYLLDQSQDKEIFHVTYTIKKPMSERIGLFTRATINRLLHQKPLV